MIFKKIFSSKKNENEKDLKDEKIKIDEEKKSWLQKLKIKLKSSNNFIKNIFSIFDKSEIDYFELEEKLLDFDIDFEIVEIIIEKLKSKEKWGQKLTPETAMELMKQTILEILNKNNLKEFSIKKNIESQKISVILFCGINGAGKTTTIAKIGSLYKNKEKNIDNLELKSLLIACDVFRAAAIEQLEFWAQKLHLDIYIDKNNIKLYSDLNINQKIDPLLLSQTKHDPASVAFSGVEYALKNNYELVLIDTSGRMHNNKSLMDELEKTNRVLKKHNPDFANEIILILDGTIGQNMISQFEMFNKIFKINGIIITKLDGLSKGGILISLIYTLNIQVYFIGIGEKEDDINYFNTQEFVNSLFD